MKEFLSVQDTFRVGGFATIELSFAVSLGFARWTNYRMLAPDAFQSPAYPTGQLGLRGWMSFSARAWALLVLQP